MQKKNKIQDYLMDYLHKMIPNFTTNKRLFTCPVCKEVSCNEFPPSSGKLHCFTPNCGKVGTIIDVCRRLEFDNCEDVPNEDIEKHLIKMFDIKTIEHVYEVFDNYVKWGWDLVPVEKNRKESWIETNWQLKSHKDKSEWIEWAKSINMGVKTGKMSNIIGIDFDFVESSLKKKIYSGKGTIQDIELANKQHVDGLELIKKEMPYLDFTTVQQKSFGGIHLFYIYDEEVPKTAFNYKGIHIDIEADGGQIVIEPSIVGGQKRIISGKTIKPLPKELKELILNNSCKIKKEEIIDVSDKCTELTFENLNGNRNNTFISLYGELRKIMSVKKAFIVLQKFNGLLDKKVPLKELKAMMNQAEKHTKCDLESLYVEVKDYFIRHNEASLRDLKECIDAETKDIKEVLARLIDDDKIYKQRSMYKNIEKADWKTEFIKESQILEYPVPFFGKYATFRRGDMVCIGAETGVGKCFGKGTKILMYDGSYKNVEDININDKIMGINSKQRTVLKTHSGIDDLYEIQPLKGEGFTVNSEHILSLYMSNTKQIQNISVKDYLQKNTTFKKYAKIYRKSVDFDTRDVPLDPYYVGLWLGDGCNVDSRICKNDFEIVNYLQHYADKLKQTLKKYSIKDNGQCAYKISSCKRGNWHNTFSIQKELRKLNLINNKHIPNIYKINSRENRLQLLAGLLDTDGYLDNGNFEILTKYETLADDIQYLAGSLGFMVTKKIKNVKHVFQNGDTNRYYYRLYIVGDCSVIPTKIKRKKALPRKINKNPLVCGFKINKLKKGKYYGFEIDGDHLHFIKNFVVQHNSYISLNIIRKLVEWNAKPKGGIRYISSEPGNRFAKIAIEMGLKEGDFYFFNHYNPEQIELEDDAITIIDWLLPEDFSQTANLYKIFSKQLDKHGGLCFIFSQLREDKHFYAGQMVKMYASLACKYFYSELNGIRDNVNTYFQTEKIRESKSNQQYLKIATIFKDKKLELK